MHAHQSNGIDAVFRNMYKATPAHFSGTRNLSGSGCRMLPTCVSRPHRPSRGRHATLALRCRFNGGVRLLLLFTSMRPQPLLCAELLAELQSNAVYATGINSECRQSGEHRISHMRPDGQPITERSTGAVSASSTVAASSTATPTELI
jgi:hypothetical protein